MTKQQNVSFTRTKIVLAGTIGENLGLSSDLKCLCTVKTSPQLHPFLERSDLATVAQAFVTYCLDDYNVLYVELPLQSIWNLQ